MNKSKADIIQKLSRSLSELTYTRVSSLLSQKRRQRIKDILEHRTLTVVPVLDGIFDRGNVNAVLRTAESLGFQQAHIIKGPQGFKYSKRVTQGAHKWIDVKRWHNKQDCIEFLKNSGYRICATSLTASIPIEEIDFTRPTAIVFGNEMEGVSKEILEASDMRCHIPMVGFTKSFNISVAAAIALYHIYKDRIRRQGFHGDLAESTKLRLERRFWLKSTPLRHKAPSSIDHMVKKLSH